MGREQNFVCIVSKNELVQLFFGPRNFSTRASSFFSGRLKFLKFYIASFGLSIDNQVIYQLVCVCWSQSETNATIYYDILYYLPATSTPSPLPPSPLVQHTTIKKIKIFIFQNFFKILKWAYRIEPKQRSIYDQGREPRHRSVIVSLEKVGRII